MSRRGKNFGGGLLNNFVFGVFGVNKCDSSDKDWYCELSRIFSAILMILVIIVIFYFIFNFLRNNVFSKIKKK